jgi:hypothetical protein
MSKRITRKNKGGKPTKRKRKGVSVIDFFMDIVNLFY